MTLARIRQAPAAGEAMPGAGFEPACPAGGHPILSRARLTSFATPAAPRIAANCLLFPWRELVARRDLRRRLADHDRNLLMGVQRQVLRIPCLLLAVDVPLEPVAVRPHAPRVEKHAPLGDELPECELTRVLRLDVDDPTRVVRMELGQVTRARVDPDESRYGDLL